MRAMRKSERGDSVGLSADEASKRLRRFGPNELRRPKREGRLERLLRQLREPMALLLIVAAGVSGFGLREPVDAGAIVLIVLLNAGIGLIQEGKAARALEALREMESPTARARRSARIREIPARELVPGDLVLLSAGDRVPADLELASASLLEADESLLTGESMPVGKVKGEAALAGTLIIRGAGEGTVTSTGSSTQMGRIAERISAREPPTPLQIELRRLTSRLGAISVAIAAGVFALTLARTGTSEESLGRAFLSAVALAVAAVPEGLATVVAISLALGVRRMATEGAIVRRLPAVETLGSTTVIATDKTGTLTRNQMTVDAIAAPGSKPGALSDLPPRLAAAVVETAVLCNDATIDRPSGDPLDLALLQAAGMETVERIRASFARVAEIPFDAERKRMTVLVRGADRVAVAVKGAPETVAPLCDHHLGAGGQRISLTPRIRTWIESTTDALTRRGMRVIALARSPAPDDSNDPAAAERGLGFVGLVGLRDAIRPEAHTAVAAARAAGIKLLMVTGDHAGTARAVAEDAGLIGPDERVLTGEDLEDGLPSDPGAVHVYARVDPVQKLELVESLQAAGEVVAVTGDGVNDAPALRRAEIGVAMGRAGSDVAKEAADMVVTDDNLVTIVSAVREGRGIYDNIRKVVDYLVAGNLSEICVVVVTMLLFPALGVPLLPLQLLWMNLLTDGLPALALAVDPTEAGLMSRPPRARSDRLLPGQRIVSLAGVGVLIAGSAIGCLSFARFVWNEPWPHARATMFTVLVAAHLLWAFGARIPVGSRAGFRDLLVNKWLVLAVLGGVALQVTIVVLPAAQDLFGTAYLTGREWLLAAVGGLLPVTLILVLRRQPP